MILKYALIKNKVSFSWLKNNISLTNKAIDDAKEKYETNVNDIVKDIESEALKQELRAALEDNGRCECLMLKTPLKKTEKSLSLPVAFLSFFNLVYIILIIFSFPSKYQITSSF